VVYHGEEYKNAADGLVDLLMSYWLEYCALRAYYRLIRYSKAAIAAKDLSEPTPEHYYAWSMFLELDRSGRYAEGELAGDAWDYVWSLGTGGLKILSKKEFWLTFLDDVFTFHFADIPILDTLDAFEFEPLPLDEVLFGVRVIHRQSWRLLGYARGELVRTVPLGPREAQRVSVRILRRRRVARTSEQATSYETSHEAGEVTKDTAEVVAEASSKLGATVSTEVSGGYGPFIQGKLSASLSAELAQSSKETNTRLNETMQKTASRMKRDTKVSVSTETETTFEESRSSELVNPNDEVGVTYLYHRLQQRHWVTTEVGEVHSVVFVPEPMLGVITEDWVREHADVLTANLIDPDFAPVIASMRREPLQLPRIDLGKFEAAAQGGIDAAREYKGYTGGGDMPDFLASGQSAYERQLDRRNAAEIDEKRRQHQAEALFAHIKRHSLHYLRAILLAEDRDHRMNRFARILVPTSWRFVPNEPVPPVGPLLPGEVPGRFIPDLTSARPLSEIIDPIGPVGFVLNCAVYRLRDDPRLTNLHQALAYLRSLYMRFEVTMTPGASAAGLSLRHAVVHTPRTFAGTFTMVYKGASQRWRLQVPGRDPGDWPELNSINGGIEMLGMRLWISGEPQDGATLEVRVFATGQLEDPHLKLVRLLHPLPETADEAALFTEATQREIRDCA
jgi:hypothetical protein